MRISALSCSYCCIQWSYPTSLSEDSKPYFKTSTSYTLTIDFIQQKTVLFLLGRRKGITRNIKTSIENNHSAFPWFLWSIRNILTRQSINPSIIVCIHHLTPNFISPLSSNSSHFHFILLRCHQILHPFSYFNMPSRRKSSWSCWLPSSSMLCNQMYGVYVMCCRCI